MTKFLTSKNLMRQCTAIYNSQRCEGEVPPQSKGSLCSRCRRSKNQKKYRIKKKELKKELQLDYSKEETLHDLPEYDILKAEEKQWEADRGSTLMRYEFPIGRCEYPYVIFFI
jgi:hypothetical protein